MITRSVWALTFSTIAGLCSAAKCADLQVLEPTGHWTANGSDGRCTLTREFLGSGVTASLTIEPIPLSNDVDLSLKGVGEGERYARFSARVTLEPGEHSVERDVTAFDTADGTQHVFRLRFLRTDLDRAAASGAVTLMVKGRLNATLSVPKLAEGLHVLDQCEKAIIQNVGLSPAQISLIAHTPEAPLMLFRWSDAYYKTADKSDLEDEAIVRYIIGTDGKPTDCSFVHQARDPKLNGGACGYMTSPSAFTPAKDKDGNPVVGLYFEQTRWHRRSDYVPPARY